jgi:pimeloyl-ACP methyl ester carboxylesterase
MLVTYRNDRDAPDGPRATYQWGRTEWRDLEGAVSYARDNGADQVVLAGYGMGGSIVLSFLGKSAEADLVVGAILDSPVIDLESTAGAHLDKAQVGAAFDMPTAINRTARLIAGWRFDIDWDDIDYGKTAPAIPMLIFHGDGDTETPLSESQAYAATAPQLVKLVVSEGADYTESWNVDPAGYESAVVAFLAGL